MPSVDNDCDGSLYFFDCDDQNSEVGSKIGNLDCDDVLAHSITSNTNHTCINKADGSVECWGSNSGGQSSPPNGFFVDISAGGGHTCGIKRRKCGIWEMMTMVKVLLQLVLWIYLWIISHMWD